jgi:hypothetical protein
MFYERKYLHVNTDSLSARGNFGARTRHARNTRANGFNGKKNYVHKNLTRNKNKCQIFTKRTILLYGPGFDSASNRKEYKEYFLEVKAASA